MGSRCFRGVIQESEHDLSNNVLLALSEITDNLQRRAVQLHRSHSLNESLIASTTQRLRDGVITKAEYKLAVTPLEIANMLNMQQLEACAREVRKCQYQEEQVRIYSMQSEKTAQMAVVNGYLKRIKADENVVDEVNDDNQDMMTQLTNFNNTHTAHVNSHLDSNENAQELEDAVRKKLQGICDEVDDMEVLELSKPTIMRRGGGADAGYAVLATTHDVEMVTTSQRGAPHSQFSML